MIKIYREQIDVVVYLGYISCHWLLRRVRKYVNYDVWHFVCVFVLFKYDAWVVFVSTDYFSLHSCLWFKG